MKYKVGDKIIVKDLTKCEDKHPRIIDEMYRYSGKELTINNYVDIDIFNVKESNFNWHEDWVEPFLKGKIKNLLNR